MNCKAAGLPVVLLDLQMLQIGENGPLNSTPRLYRSLIGYVMSVAVSWCYDVEMRLLPDIFKLSSQLFSCSR